MHSREEIGQVRGACGQKTVSIFVAGLIFFVFFIWASLGAAGCSYPQQSWGNYKKYIKRSIETPVTAGGRCEKRGGLYYGEKCYAASSSDFDQQNCRLRGGLFVEEECYFPENNRIVIE